MKIITLDCDGVLNNHTWNMEAASNTIDPDKMARINYILRETAAKIVLSSAWRYLIHRGEMNLKGLDWLFRSHGMIAGSIIDITRKDGVCQAAFDRGQPWIHVNERGQQIADWLADHPEIETYCVIDDMDLGISELHGSNFVQTDGKVGITDSDVERVLEILNA